MKKKQLILCMGLSAMSLFTSCLSDEHSLDLTPDIQGDSQTGEIILNLNADASFIEQTRALNEDEYSNTANYTVQVYNNAEPTKFIVNTKYSEVDPQKLKSLVPGTYTVKAFYGTELNYSRDKFYVVGENNNVAINAGDEVSVPLSCTPTCGRIRVEFDSEMATYYDDYDVTFTEALALGNAGISWSSTDTEPWYVKLAPEGETIRYTISLTAKEQYAYTNKDGEKQTSGTVSKTFTLQRNKAYNLKIKPHHNPMTEGGISIIIEIDDNTNTPIDIPVEVGINWLS